MDILSAMRDPSLFGRWFDAPSWDAWRTFLAALFGLPMPTADACASYFTHTGRSTYAPGRPAREGWLVVGRRGGKSRIAALVGVFVACFHAYDNVLAPGEVGTVAIIAADRRQARTIMRYIVGFLEGVPLLKAVVVARTKETISLSNRILIEVHTASFRAVRGYTLVAVIADEVAFWPSDEAGANPDTEILNGLRPGMATVSSALLLCISSPYARRGALWEAYRKHYGRDNDPVLVWQAATTAMNPTVDAQVIADAYADDDAAAAAEYGARFRTDVESFISREAVEAVVTAGRRELPPQKLVRYRAFCDPSGGSQDSMTLAVAHREQQRAVLDIVVEHRAPFNPDFVVEDFAAVLRTYGLSSVVGDRYAASWPVERFRAHGIRYEPHPRLIAQLLGLERRTARSGKDSIDHPPRSHDDIVNAAAGALVAVAATIRPAARGIERPVVTYLPEYVRSWGRRIPAA